MAYAPHELVDKWRRKASEVMNPFIAKTLRECADEMEKYHHDDNHDAEWVTSGCPHCARERGEAGAE